MYLGYVIAARLFTDATVAGWASTIGVIVFLGGVQLVALWVMGEYLARIAEEVRGRPPYIIDPGGSVMPEDETPLVEECRDSSQRQGTEPEVAQSTGRH